MEYLKQRNPGERVLVLAPTGRDAPLAAAVLEEVEIDVAICNDADRLRKEIDNGAGTLLLAEEGLIGIDLAALIERLSSQETWSDIPIVLITRRSSDTAANTLRTMTMLGPNANITLLERPFRRITLISTIESALASRRRQYQVRDLLDRLDSYAGTLEERVDERTAQLQETIHFLESFCYSIAHDLRAPLRTIQGMSTILLEDYAPSFDDDGRDYANRIAAAAERMDYMIVDLLTYGRLSQQALTCERVSVREQVNAALNLLSDTIEAKNAEIEIRSPLDDVWAHPTALRQILTNLIANALKFVEPGRRPHIEIYSIVGIGETTVRVCVRDNGIGISSKYQGRIFGVFERLHNPDQYPGTGIGLALVRKGAERMGGRAGVDSKPGDGSCFWVELLRPDSKGHAPSTRQY